MSKKIVILNGSPRRSGNTSTLVKSSGQIRTAIDRLFALEEEDENQFGNFTVKLKILPHFQSVRAV